MCVILAVWIVITLQISDIEEYNAGEISRKNNGLEHIDRLK